MRKLFLLLVWMTLLTALACAGMGGYLWYVWSSNLPYVGSIKEYRPPVVSEVFSDDGQCIGAFWEERRYLLPQDEMPQRLVLAFVAAEDARFFDHQGLDFKGILRALLKNLEAGKIEQGGSTITQQVTKTLLLKETERTFKRKVREAFLAVQIEKALTKEEILHRYLNQIYLGEGAYGVQAAALTYFGKPAKDLSLAEAAILAGLPQAPSRFSPVSHFDKAKARQKYVLQRMLEEGMITRAEFQEASEVAVTIQPQAPQGPKCADYFVEHVRRLLLGRYGPDVLYRGGLKIHTTLNLDMQREATTSVQKGLTELEAREGYRGPVRHLTEEEGRRYMNQVLEKAGDQLLRSGATVEGLVESVNPSREEASVWLGKAARGRLRAVNLTAARKVRKEGQGTAFSTPPISQVLKKGDVLRVKLLERLEGAQELWELALLPSALPQGALLCMLPETGEVKAMVGGRDYSSSQFNRAIQSRRQPGSAFKPIIYAAALDRGYTPARVIVDSPFVAGNPADEDVWRPKNYKRTFAGRTLMRTALAESMNVVTVKILKDIGVPYAIDYAKKLGIQSELSPDLTLALGSSGVSLLELSTAYAAFANGGERVTPLFVSRILDRDGRLLEETPPEQRQAISEATAYVMTELLRAVVQEGTGQRVKALNRPAAGKTGTTNELRDAWFIGYTPQILTGVWVGYDDVREMGKGESGAKAALPIWLLYMSEILKGKPVLDFQVPAGIVFAKIDAETGLLATPESERSLLQAFVQGTEPKEHTQKQPLTRSGDFFQMDMDSDL